jgi:hypothetical protein
MKPRRLPWLVAFAAVVLVAACGSSGGDGDGKPADPNDDGSNTNNDLPRPQGDGGSPTPAADAGAPESGSEAEDPPIPYQHFDVNHVLSTGQSNSVAHEGRPVLSNAQPYGNLMFNVGVMTSGACEREGCRTYQKPTGFSPLVEGDTFWYPVETASSGLANQVSKLATTQYRKPSHDVLVSLAGRNGLTYWCLRRGGCNFLDPTYLNAFDESMRQAQDGKALAQAAGKSYVVRAATSIHGESDDFAYATNTQEFPLDGTDGTHASITSYADGLIEWQRDYEAGVKAITGQTVAVPLLISQFSGWNDFAYSAVTQLQYEAHVRSKGKVVIVGPGYPLEWFEDCRHYSNHGERHLGEYFAKVYARIVLEGRQWEPVRPRTVTVAGNVVTARYFVPVPPLVLDTERISDPGNYGFEVVDAAGTLQAITAVALTGPDTVAITLAAPPVAGSKLRYAFTTTPMTCPGQTSGPRGNLRDSDKTPSQSGYELFNWGVHYAVAIP